MIIIINHGLGNVGSLANTLQFLGIGFSIWSDYQDSEDIKGKKGFILPGVGSFDEGMRAMKEKKLDSVVMQFRELGIRGMGICLGMQLLCESSDEGKPGVRGLGLFEGNIERLDTKDDFVPNVGWNHTFSTAVNSKTNNTLDNTFYYVHSFGLYAKNNKNVAAVFKHGKTDIAAAIQKDNIMGVQFHPEKSQAAGLSLLQSFFSETL